MPKVIIIDNYDSFTYNLVQTIAVLPPQPQIVVLRNDTVTGPDLQSHQPTPLIFSPGPCTPTEAGHSRQIIRHWAGKIPILGVCLGYQSIAEAYGAKIVRADRCMHGKTSQITHDGSSIFQDLENPFTAMRYHSLIVDPQGLHSDFQITAHSEQNEIMALSNQSLKLEGVQFHPESFATPQGPKLLQNFLTSY
ncbi:MAG: aminodeoxychorismate/anthranilate synthase component II [Planctomycetes bacterium]|nr:aminodeoxychorismate/anthranilate synthase component II [Planctomycetota bacterium]